MISCFFKSKKTLFSKKAHLENVFYIMTLNRETKISFFLDKKKPSFTYYSK